MMILGTILTVLSAICAGWAILYQKSDHSRDYGSTMGGEMTTAAIWSLVALTAGIGIGILSEWFWGLAVFVGIYVGSFGLRAALASLMSSTSGEMNKSTEQ